jgi:hypothetical protein
MLRAFVQSLRHTQRQRAALPYLHHARCGLDHSTGVCLIFLFDMSILLKFMMAGHSWR